MIAIMSSTALPLSFLAHHGATLRCLASGSSLFRRDDPVVCVFEVATGGIGLLRHTVDGQALILQQAGPGDLIAEASLFAERYHCDAIASTETEILTLDRSAWLAVLSERPDVLLSLTARFAQEVQRLRARLEIAGLPRVRDRLDAWVALNGAPPRPVWKRVAAEIGVSPEALYRELSRRRAFMSAPCPEDRSAP